MGCRKAPCSHLWCSDERCRLCLKSGTGCRRKLSMAEQIELYEKYNTPGCPPPDAK